MIAASHASDDTGVEPLMPALADGLTAARREQPSLGRERAGQVLRGPLC